MANTRRENRLEELGRVDAEHADTAKGKKNLHDERRRIRDELIRKRRNPFKRLSIADSHRKPTMLGSYQKGGKAKPWGSGPKPGTHEFMMQHLHKRKGKAKGGHVKSRGKAIRGGGAEIK